MAATVLDPLGIPQGVISYRIDDACSQWVRDYIVRNADQIFLSPNCTIMKALLPDIRVARKRFVDLKCRLALYVPDTLTERLVAFQREQPMKMIRHDDERERFNLSDIMFVSQRPHNVAPASYV